MEKILRGNTLKVPIMAGLLAGLLLFFSPSAFLLLSAAAVALVILARMDIPLKEKQFVTYLFLAVLFIRMFLSASVYSFMLTKGGEGSVFHDDVGWPRLGWVLYETVTGEMDYTKLKNCEMLSVNEQSLKEGYLILIASVYGVIRSYAPLSAKYINVFLGALSVVFLYGLARRMIGERTAKFTAVCAALFPSLTLWSIVSLKDTSCIFAIVLLFWCVDRYAREKVWKVFFIAPLPLIFIFTIRKQLMYLVLFSVLTSCFVNLRMRHKVAWLIAGLVAAVLFLPAPVKAKAWGFLEGQISPRACWVAQKGFVDSGGNTYRIFPDKYYEFLYPGPVEPVETAKALFKGFWYFLLAPFPWAVCNKSQLAIMPQMMLWYLMLPLALKGIIFVFRTRFKRSVMIISFVGAMTLLLAMREGNIGTLVRHRDQMTPYLIMFAAAGFIKRGTRSGDEL